MTQCQCTHLTSFGGDFVVPPNTIDFSTVFSAEKFLEAVPVFVTVALVLLLYVGALIWARRADKKDVLKVSHRMGQTFQNQLVGESPFRKY